MTEPTYETPWQTHPTVKDVLDLGYVRLVDSMPSVNTPVLRPEDLPGDLSESEGWGPGDQRVVEAARVSTAGTRKRSDHKLLEFLYTHKHTTPFEQVRFTFEVKLPIFVARQWIRHRTGSFNEVSARYSVLPDDFYVPTIERIQAQSTTNKQGSGEQLHAKLAEIISYKLTAHNEESYRLYKDLIDSGLTRELARMVLPVNIYTKWFWTTDLHNLLHFLRLRMDAHAQWEIQQYGLAIKDLIRPIAPYTVHLAETSGWR